MYVLFVCVIASGEIEVSSIRLIRRKKTNGARSVNPSSQQPEGRESELVREGQSQRVRCAVLLHSQLSTVFLFRNFLLKYLLTCLCGYLVDSI